MSFQVKAMGEGNQVGEYRVDRIVARFAGRALVWLGMALAFLALAAAGALAAPQTAGAETFYGHIGEFGGAGTADGEFGFQPSRVAVHEQSGKLLVADTPNDRVQVFAPVEGESAGGFPASHAFTFDQLDDGSGGTTPMSEPIAVAVDQSTGAAYVALAGAPSDGGTIARFTPDDPNEPGAYTHDPTFEPQPFPTGIGSIEPGSFGEVGASNGIGPNRAGLAVDSSSDVLLLDPGRNWVWRYLSDGTADGLFDGGGALGEDPSPDGSFQELLDLGVNSSNDVIVVDAIDGGGAIRIERFDDTNDWQETISPAPDDLLGPGDLGAIVAVDAVTDEVFVSAKPDTSITAPMEIHQYVYDAANDEHTHAGFFGVPDDFADGDRFDGNIYGMDVRSSDPGRFYALATQRLSTFGGTPIPRVQTFEAIIPPEVTFGSVDDITATGASFSGTIEGHGDPPSAWRFDYRPDGAETWQRVPDPPEQLDGTEPLPHAVATDAEDLAEPLEPNTDYEVRICANNGVEVCTATETFLTEPTDPVARTGEAWSVTPDSATLEATVNPRNSETEYFFEYGTDETYGNRTEAVSAGNGGEPVQVTADIDGLDPATTHHFRIVATNVEFPEQDLGDVGEDATFDTRTAAETELPERGYELVSHVDNRGIGAYGLRSAPSGDAYMTYSVLPATGAENSFIIYQRMTRIADGSWDADPHMPTPPVDPERPILGFAATPLLSADLSLGMFQTTGSYHPMDQNRVEGEDTGQDIYTRSTETGDLTWLSRDERLDDDEPQTDPANVGRYQYLSPDGSIAIFDSGVRPGRVLHPDHDPDAEEALYKWDSGGLSVVSLAPGGDAVSGTLGSGNHTLNAVSPEGDRIVFGSSGSLYVRIEDERTVEIGGGDDSDLGDDARYFGADSQTTEIVYVRNGTLYLFDVAAAESTEIASPVATPVTNRAVFGVSNDADRIYFSSPAELTPDAGGADRYLYLAERGGGSEHELSLVSELHPDDRGINVPAPATQNDVDVDSTGSILAFTSELELVPGRRNGGFPQVYIYEAEGEQLYCASCPPNGSVPGGRGDIGSKGSSGLWLLSSLADHRMPAWSNVTESGTVFFQSAARLTPGDGNRAVDTYEWRGGEVRLVSSGRGRDHEVFADASADGETVFFQSRQELVPASGAVPGVPRVYAARIGGGFIPPEREVECVGEECREASHVPDEIAPGTEQGEEPRAAAPGNRQLQRRSALLAQRFLAVKRRAIVLRRAALRTDDLRRRQAIVKRYRLVVRRAVVLRRATIRCRRALR